jgi:hypothetical protein
MPVPVTLLGLMVDLSETDLPARRGSPGSAIALGVAVATLAACGAGTPVTRGFGSREVLQIRDSTFGFTGWGINTIDYSASVDGGYTNGSIQIGPVPPPTKAFRTPASSSATLTPVSPSHRSEILRRQRSRRASPAVDLSGRVRLW